ncbi:MAG: sodium:calcium antiporter [bacterium]
MSNPNHRYEVSAANWWTLIVTLGVTVPGFFLGLTHAETTPLLGSLLFGIAIFGAAFMLSWAAEAAQIDISESLAVAILALLAVLPEYAVDFVFTWRAAHIPEEAHYAIANMTGANRLLVGLGWPAVLAIYVLAKKRKEIIMDSGQRVEVFYLAMATIYSFTIPLKGSLNLIDTVILVTLFGLYTRRVAGMKSVEPEVIGPVKIIANMSNRPRRLATVGMFGFAGAVIFFVAEPFAHSLVAMGSQFGVDEFLLVQWLAPIASEAPEFIVAATWASRGMAGSALKALISSKVNQWTLLVGTIPLVFSISSGAVRAFPLDELQNHELLLTAAQSLFALAVIVNLRFSRAEGLLLFGLFAAQLVVEQIRMEVMVIYIILAVVYLVLQRQHLLPAMRTGLGLKEK